MVQKRDPNTWQEDPADIIVLVNQTRNNYILNLPAGHYRLDAGRKMKTLKSILDIPGVRELVDQGHLVIGNE
jgi:hypothetical protein